MSIARVVRLVRLFAWQSALQTLAYPFVFWTGALAKLFRVGFTLVFLQAVYLQVPEIAGWTYPELVLVFMSYYVLDFLAKATFFRNLFGLLPNRIRDGRLDTMLIKPVPALPFIAFNQIDLLDLVNLLPALGGIGWAIVALKLRITLELVATYVGLMAIGYVFVFGLSLLVSSIFFRTVEGSAISRLVHEIMRFGRFPVSIYHHVLQFILLFVVPVVLVALVPGGAILGKIDPNTVLLSSVVGILFFGLGRAVWYRQLRYYESASS